MGIRFTCPTGHKLHVKEYLAGKRAVCPHCGAKVIVPPAESPAPVPSEAAKAEWPPVGFGSQSIVIPTLDPSTFAPAAGPAPPLAFPDAALLSAAPLSGAVEPQPIGAIDALPPPEATPLVGALPKRGRSQSRTQIVIALFLMAIVIVLIGVLVFVLSHGPNAAPGETPPTEKSASTLLPPGETTLLAFPPINITPEGRRT